MIEILLPVYNGEKYLVEQIESIIGQTNTEWILKIRNDGSKDNSQTIINRYCHDYPDKIIAIDSPKENVGLVQSLNYLLAAEPHCDYIMFSDQDDIWNNYKIECSLNEIKKLEQIYNKIPLGVCTDSQCINSKLEITASSFFRSQKFPDNILGNIHKMLALNIVQGCTLITNNLAKEKYYPLPSFLNVHDMWIAVIIAFYGKIFYYKNTTMSYRQHEQNVLGEINVNLQYYLNRSKSILNTISLLRQIQSELPFKTNLIEIIYYKLYYAFRRIFT